MSSPAPRPPRPSVIDLDRLLNKVVRVKFTGGRELTGTLRGHDQIPNLVLDDTIEHLRTRDDPYVLSGETRNVGVMMVRGTSIVAIAPEEGVHEISNPFLPSDE